MKWAKYILFTKLTRTENRLKQTLWLTGRIQPASRSHARLHLREWQEAGPARS